MSGGCEAAAVLHPGNRGRRWFPVRAPNPTCHPSQQIRGGTAASAQGLFLGRRRSHERARGQRKGCGRPHVVPATVLPPAWEGIPCLQPTTPEAAAALCSGFGTENRARGGHSRLWRVTADEQQQAACLTAHPAPGVVTRGDRSPHVVLSPPRPSESTSPVLGARRGAGPGAHREEALSVPSKSPQPSEILSHEPQIASQQDDMWRETLGRGWGYVDGAPTSWGQEELGKATRRR